MKQGEPTGGGGPALPVERAAVNCFRGELTRFRVRGRVRDNGTTLEPAVSGHLNLTPIPATRAAFSRYARCHSPFQLAVRASPTRLQSAPFLPSSFRPC